jgi:hypothetical protein
VYGCECPALIELGSSKGAASQESIDRVKTAYGFTEEPKWLPLTGNGPLESCH